MRYVVQTTKANIQLSVRGAFLQTNNSKRQTSGDYAILVSKTLPFIKGHRYKLSIILPYKIAQEKLAKKCGLGKEEFAVDPSRYPEIFECFLAKQVFEKCDHDVTFWETKINEKQHFTENYLKQLEIFEIKNAKPILIHCWFYTDKKIDKKEIQDSVEVAIQEIIEVDILGCIMIIDSLKVMPKEVTTKSHKINLKPILEKMLSETEQTSKIQSGDSV